MEPLRLSRMLHHMAATGLNQQAMVHLKGAMALHPLTHLLLGMALHLAVVMEHHHLMHHLGVVMEHHRLMHRLVAVMGHHRLMHHLVVGMAHLQDSSTNHLDLMRLLLLVIV